MTSTGDGFTMAVQQPQTLDGSGNVPSTLAASVFASPDGSTWTQTADLPDFGLISLGVMNGQAILGGSKSSGTFVFNVVGPSGVIATINPADALPEEALTFDFWGASAVGPLGWAAIAYNSAGDGPRLLVHSDPTGTQQSAVPLPDELDDWGNVVGLTVTADAIIVRFTATPDGNPASLEPQRLFVGTPTG
jgi:hypothetical protein